MMVRTVAVGETVAGSLDHFLDWDWYSVRLKEGQTVRISTDSINIDTVLYVDFPKSRNNQVVSDDDSGGGLGGNSELIYRAPHTGEYFIAVTEAVGDRLEGYFLSVESAREGMETVSVPPSPQAFDPEAGSDILIVAQDVLALGAGELSLTKYADLVESSVLIPSGAEDISRETVQTSQGLPAVIFQNVVFQPSGNPDGLTCSRTTLPSTLLTPSLLIGLRRANNWLPTLSIASK